MPYAAITMASSPTRLGFSPLPAPYSCLYANGLRLALFPNQTTLTLSSSKAISGFSSILPNKLSPVISAPSKPPLFTVFAAKGYKMKTHKASAKRFRVTGKGKIVRRRAGKQHLLGKKNTKRKLRLSKMV